MAKIAVIGDKEITLGFKAIGVTSFAFEDVKELPLILNEIKNNDYELIFVSEKAYLSLENELKEFEEAPVPAVIVIPSVSENLGVADNHINNIVQKAVGMKIGE
jgi:vacuolar-type H+-ATPase subunit F/Vma7